MRDKNIQIRIQKSKTETTTLTVKLSLLELYSQVSYNKSYDETKKLINKNIRNLVNPDSKHLSEMVTKFLHEQIQFECKSLKNS